MLGDLRPKRWLPELVEVANAVPLLQLRAFGPKQWSAQVYRGESRLVTATGAQLFLAFGSNLTRNGCTFVLAFDQGNDRLPGRLDRAVYGTPPAMCGAPWNLDLPFGSRRFQFGIFLIASTDPQFYRPALGADLTFQYAYLEVS